MVGNKFQDVILKYSRAKIGEGRPANITASCSLVNALCGDEIVVYLGLSEHSNIEVFYEAKGCSLCAASASIMSESLTGVTPDVARDLIGRFLEKFPLGIVLTDDGIGIESLFDMRRFPARERCVLLPWQAVLGCFT